MRPRVRVGVALGADADQAVEVAALLSGVISRRGMRSTSFGSA